MKTDLSASDPTLSNVDIMAPNILDILASFSSLSDEHKQQEDDYRQPVTSGIED